MRFTDIKVLGLLALLLGCLALVPELREARAEAGDPYVAQRVGWLYTGPYLSNETYSTGTTSSASIYGVNWMGQSFAAFPGEIQKISIYGSKSGSPPNPLTVELRNNDGTGKPGTTIYRTVDIPAASVPGASAWFNATFASPLRVNASIKMAVVLHTTAGDASNRYIWLYDSTSSTYRDGTYCYSASTNSGASWTATATSDFAFMIYIKLWYNGLTTTSDSDTFGSGASTQFRFNFTYSFPSGSSERALNCTYPTISYRLNVSTSGGSLISASSYTDSSFNGTHRIVEIPEAVISVSGEAYSLFTHRWPAVYYFEGLYYENGTFKGDVELSMANSSGTWAYDLDGVLTIGTSEIPEAFIWPHGDYTRYISPYETEENYTITYSDGDLAVYSFMIRDFVGITGGQDCYLESYRTINGTQELIERIKITTTINGVPLSLTQNRIYIISIYDSTMDVGHEYGYFMPGDYNREPSLTLQEMSFTDQAQMVSQYVRTEAQREDPYTSIVVIYNNTLSSEYNADANLLVKKRDGTLIYNSTTSDDAHTWTVPGLTNTTDYIIFLTVTHEFWGTLKWTKILSGTHLFFSPPDLGVLGSWGGIPSGNILSAGLILLVAGLFSFLSAGLGIFIIVVLSAGLIRLGWISTVSSGIIIVCLGLAIMLALSQRLRR